MTAYMGFAKIEGNFYEKLYSIYTKECQLILQEIMVNQLPSYVYSRIANNLEHNTTIGNIDMYISNGLLLCGPPGSGRSTILNGILQYLETSCPYVVSFTRCIDCREVSKIFGIKRD